MTCHFQVLILVLKLTLWENTSGRHCEDLDYIYFHEETWLKHKENNYKNVYLLSQL